MLGTPCCGSVFGSFFDGEVRSFSLMVRLAFRSYPSRDSSALLAGRIVSGFSLEYLGQVWRGMTSRLQGGYRESPSVEHFQEDIRDVHHHSG